MKKKMMIILIALVSCLLPGTAAVAASLATLDNLTVEKKVAGDKVPTGMEETFTFEITADASDPTGNPPMPSPATVTINGVDIKAGNATAKFAPIAYENPGIYVYKVTESAGSNINYVYDLSEHKVIVTVKADGTLSCKVDTAVPEYGIDLTITPLIEAGSQASAIAVRKPTDEDITSTVTWTTSPNDLISIDPGTGNIIVNTANLNKQLTEYTTVTITATDSVTGKTSSKDVSIKKVTLKLNGSNSVFMGGTSGEITVKSPDGSQIITNNVNFDFQPTGYIEINNGVITLLKNPPVDTPVIVMATDTASGVTGAFTVNVLSKPLLIETSPAALSMTIPGTINVKEPDGTTDVTSSASFTDPDGYVSVDASGNVTIVKNPPEDRDITITVVDQNGVSTDKTIRVLSEPLKITSSPEVTMGTPGTITVLEPNDSNVTATSTYTDPEGYVSVDSSGNITVIKNPPVDKNITIKVTDENGVTADVPIVVKTKPLSIENPPASAANGDDPLKKITVKEPDGTEVTNATWTITDSAGGAINWVTIDPDGTIHVTKNPKENTVIRVKPTDANGVTCDPIDITIETKPLIIVNPPTSAANGDDPLTKITVQEPDGTAVTNASWTVTDSAGGAIDWVTIDPDGKIHVNKNPKADTDIKITPTDTNGVTCDPVTVTIKNKPLTITATDIYMNTPGTISVKEPDGTDITSDSGTTYSMSPSGYVEIDPAAGKITALQNPADDISIQLTVTDGNGVITTETLTLKPVPLNVSTIPSEASFGNDPSQKITVTEPDGSSAPGVTWEFKLSDGTTDASDFIEVQSDGTLHVLKNPKADTVIKLRPKDANGVKGEWQTITIKAQPLTIINAPESGYFGSDPENVITVNGPDGNPAPNVTWNICFADGSDASDFAEIGTDGKVHIKKNPDSSKVILMTPTDENGATCDSFTFTIGSKPLTLDVDKDGKYGLNRGGHISVKGPDGNDAPGPITFVSGDPDLVNVKSDGVIEILKNPESDNTIVTITVTDGNGVTSTKDIVVRQETLKITPSGSPISPKKNGGATATLQPWGDNITGLVSCEDPSGVLSVDNDGTVHVAKTPETFDPVSITCTDSSGLTGNTSFTLAVPLTLAPSEFLWYDPSQGGTNSGTVSPVHLLEGFNGDNSSSIMVDWANNYEKYGKITDKKWELEGTGKELLTINSYETQASIFSAVGKDISEVLSDVKVVFKGIDPNGYEVKQTFDLTVDPHPADCSIEISRYGEPGFVIQQSAGRDMSFEASHNCGVIPGGVTWTIDKEDLVYLQSGTFEKMYLKNPYPYEANDQYVELTASLTDKYGNLVSDTKTITLTAPEATGIKVDSFDFLLTPGSQKTVTYKTEPLEGLPLTDVSVSLNDWANEYIIFDPSTLTITPKGSNSNGISGQPIYVNAKNSSGYNVSGTGSFNILPALWSVSIYEGRCSKTTCEGVITPTPKNFTVNAIWEIIPSAAGTVTCDIDPDTKTCFRARAELNSSYSGKYTLKYTVTDSNGITMSASREFTK